MDTPIIRRETATMPRFSRLLHTLLWLPHTLLPLLADAGRFLWLCLRPSVSLLVPLQAHQHRIPEHLRVMTRPIPGGWHHDYRLLVKAA